MDSRKGECSRHSRIDTHVVVQRLVSTCVTPEHGMAYICEPVTTRITHAGVRDIGVIVHHVTALPAPRIVASLAEVAVALSHRRRPVVRHLQNRMARRTPAHAGKHVSGL